MIRPFLLCLVVAFLAKGLPASAGDWPRWGGSSHCNMVSEEKGLPMEFQPGADASRPGVEPLTGANVKWVVNLGVRTHGSPTVAQGKLFIGTATASAGGWLLCLDEKTGKLRWELLAPKLPERRAPHSDNGYGVCSSATVEGNRVYLVNNRTDVLCLDIDGLANGNDGPFQDEAYYLAGADDVAAGPRPKSS